MKQAELIKKEIELNGLSFIKVAKKLDMNINEVKRIYNEEIKELTIVYVIKDGVKILEVTNDITKAISRLNKYGFNITSTKQLEHTQKIESENGVSLEIKYLDL